MQEIFKEFDKVNERVDGLDQRIDGLDKGLNERIDKLDKGLNRKLDDIDRQLRVLVEQSHHDLGDAGHDAEEVLKDHDRHLENRVARLEEVVGITAA